MKFRSTKSLQRGDSQAGEVERRNAESSKNRSKKTLKLGYKVRKAKMRSEMKEERETMRNVVRGIGEWNFVGDSLSPAVCYPNHLLRSSSLGFRLGVIPVPRWTFFGLAAF
ncbi:hypothetical protein V6Z11_D04G210900 [Gossypium hirsutum]